MFQIYDINLARARLSRTIVQIDGEFVYVVEVEGGPRGITLYDTHEKAWKFPGCNISYDKLSIGMMNSGKNIYWTYRYPVRRWKVGLNTGNYAGVHLPTGNSVSGNYLFQDTASILTMLRGEYPSWKQALKASGGCGVSRQFAVLAGRYLFYRAQHVGRIVPGGKATLEKEFAYLQELLELEVPNAVA